MKNQRLRGMKRVFVMIVALVAMGSVYYSCEDAVDTDNIKVTGVPPRFTKSNVSADYIKGTAFDIKGFWTDGATSPLASGTIQILDKDGDVVASVTESLSGESDSIVWVGSANGSASLDTGKYKVTFAALDSDNGAKRDTVAFTIKPVPTTPVYAKAENQIWIRGNFNSWGADPMELVADNTWEIEVTMDGGGWKFANTNDWSDKDWADTNCDNVAENPNGGANTECGFFGEAVVTFNDLTYSYTVDITTPPASNLTGLYVVGAFTGSAALNSYKFNLTGDNTWSLNDVWMSPGNTFKFVESADFNGKIYGDNNPADGKAESFGASIDLVSGSTTGLYDITFNDLTLNYTVTRSGNVSIGIIGNATPGGWDADTDLAQIPGTPWYSLSVTLTAGEAKFRFNDSWDVNYGAADFPAGKGVRGGANIPVPAGTYLVLFNPATGEYIFQ